MGAYSIIFFSFNYVYICSKFFHNKNDKNKNKLVEVIEMFWNWIVGIPSNIVNILKTAKFYREFCYVNYVSLKIK